MRLWKAITLTSVAKAYWIIGAMIGTIITARFLGPQGRGGSPRGERRLLRHRRWLGPGARAGRSEAAGRFPRRRATAPRWRRAAASQRRWHGALHARQRRAAQSIPPRGRGGILSARAA